VSMYVCGIDSVRRRMIRIEKMAFRYALVLFVAVNLPCYATSSSPSSPSSPSSRSSPSVPLVPSRSLPSSLSSSESGYILLRVRKIDGSVERVNIPDDAQDSTALSDILASVTLDGDVDVDGDGDGDVDGDKPAMRCQIGSNRDIDISRSVSSLGLKHGSLVSIIPPIIPSSSSSAEIKIKSASASASTSASTSSTRLTAFDPYPDLAKASSYTAAARRQRALSRLPNRRGTSYSQISKLQSNMHTIEPQSTGTIKRIYMCQRAAERFKDGCSSAATAHNNRNRVALVFGTIHNERLDQSTKLVRTSLSTPLHEATMCKVVKVHALWEPTQRPPLTPGPYDARALHAGYTNINVKHSRDYTRALHLAQMLGLHTVGWIYSYSDDRTKIRAGANTDQDALPVWGRDLVTGARGQIHNMEKLGNQEGCNYVTLAMDAHSGATEAFQFSDVCVQMIAEGVLPFQSLAKDNQLGGRLVTTTEPVVIDGKETTELDSVLCLVNTAMLSHVGRYAGKERTTSIKRGGKALTAKSKMRILDKIQMNGTTQNDAALVEELCDFNLLIVLDRLLGKNDTRELCAIVSKYTRGQKKGIVVPKQLKLILRSILEG